MQQPDQYDYGDPELWEALGHSAYDAQELALCYSEFWRYAYAWPNPEQIANAHEVSNWNHRFTCPLNPYAIAARDARRPSVFEFGGKVDPEVASRRIWPDAVFRAGLKEAIEAVVSSRKPANPAIRKRTTLPDGAIFISGHRLVTQMQLQPFSKAFMGANGPQWGPVRLPPESHNGHYCIVGMTRSGKTVLIRHMIASLKKHCRFVVYDDKTDLVPFLAADPGTPAAPLYILNPFDSRSVAWDIAKDAHAPHRADEIAHVLIPDQPGQNPYFVETPRALVATTINALNRRAPGNWSFLDLLIALENIQTILKHDEPSKRVLDQHLAAANETVSGVLSTLAGLIRPYKTAAAAWSHATQRLSITEWARSATGTLVLGNHANYEYAMRNINRVLIHLLAQTLLDPKMRSTKNPRTYIILDELHQLGTLQKLDPMLNQGAGLRMNLVLGFQDIQTLRKCYGEATDGLISQCAHFAFFRIGNPTTAHWASAFLGTQEVLRPQEALSNSADKKDVTTVYTHMERPIVRPAELQQLPLTTPVTGLTAYFKSICHPPYRAHIPGGALFLGVKYPAHKDSSMPTDIASGLLIPPRYTHPCCLPLDPASASGLVAFDGRPDEQLFFPEQHSPHLEQLGFPQAPPPAPPAPTAAPPPAKQNDFDPDSFPRLRGRRPPKETR